jgi:hypothetical protein
MDRRVAALDAHDSAMPVTVALGPWRWGRGAGAVALGPWRYLLNARGAGHCANPAIPNQSNFGQRQSSKVQQRLTVFVQHAANQTFDVDRRRVGV